MSVRITVGKRPIPQLTTTLSTRHTSHDGSTGHLPWAKRLNPKMNPGGSTSYHRVPHRSHHLREGKKIEPGNFLSKRVGSDAARLLSLGTDDPLNRGHPRSIEKEVEL